MLIPRALVFTTLAACILQAAHAETIWRRDWKGDGSPILLFDNSLGTPRASSDEVGAQTLTVLSGAVRTFNHNDVGGFDIIPRDGGSTDLFQIQIQVNGGTTYDPDQRYTMDFVIGSGAGASRTGNWFLRFGTLEDGVFKSYTPYWGTSSYESGSIELGELENFQDDENPVGRFEDQNVGGRHVQLRFVPPPEVPGKAVV